MCLKWFLTSCSTSELNEFLLSNIVKTTPSKEIPEFKPDLIVSIVFISALNPSKAKNSHWSGTITELAATKLLIVNKPSAGGQSIKIKS